MIRVIRTAWLVVLLGAAPATTQVSNYGPDTVVLRELQHLYQPVPFNHRSHAQMAEMWDGCTTCHHRSPSTQPSTLAASIDHKDQNRSADVPACKSCHEAVVQSIDAVDMHMPTLKGAYHRQCLNCHREWANANSCNACHEPLEQQASNGSPPTADDIVGRMHPPIPEPEVKIYKTRFTPAVGANVMFRHKEHVAQFNLKCVNCHRHDNCASCHADNAQSIGGPRPLHPGRTWKDTHGPCVSCHHHDGCRTCHYDDGQMPPPEFDHRMTGQVLDKDHASLKCGACHEILKVQLTVGCGDASCHKSGKVIAYPSQRPGPIVTTQPVATTEPSTKPVVEVHAGPAGTVKRVRRGAQ